MTSVLNPISLKTAAVLLEYVQLAITPPHVNGGKGLWASVARPVHEKTANGRRMSRLTVHSSVSTTTSARLPSIFLP